MRRGWFLCLCALVAVLSGAVALYAIAELGKGTSLADLPWVVVAMLVGAFVPGATKAAWYRFESARTARRLLRPSPPDDAVATMLRPDRGIVEFQGRHIERGRLHRWCSSAAGKGLALVTGPAGTGKTRLALQLAAELRQEAGWNCVSVEPGREIETLTALAGRGDLLLIVDYAETRPRLSELLAALLAAEGRVRVLLLARSVQDWWLRLNNAEPAIRALHTGAEQLRLGRFDDGRDDAELARDALPWFLAALGLPEPERPPRFVAGERPQPILVAHAAALQIALGLREAPGKQVELGLREAPDPQLRLTVNREVLPQLLSHEHRYWWGIAERRRLLDGATGIDTVVLSQALAVMCVFRCRDDESAHRQLRRVPRLRKVSIETLNAVTGWLSEVYPPEGEWRAGWLQPDLLGEYFVARQFSDDSRLADACLTELTEAEAAEVLTVLDRAAADHPAMAELLGSALTRRLPELAAAAVRVATETGGAITAQLAAAMDSATVDLDGLRAIDAVVPFPSTALTAAGLRLWRRILAATPPGQRRDLAVAHRSLGLRYAMVDNQEKALHHCRESVRLYRELAADPAEPVEPYEFARSLAALAKTLNDMGGPAEAEPLADEALRLYRTVGPHSDPKDRNNKAIVFRVRSDIREHRQDLVAALSDLDEAERLLTPLADEQAAVFVPSLSQLLYEQAMLLARAERITEALARAERAAEHIAPFAITAADRHDSEAAAIRDVIADLTNRLGDPERARPYAVAAVDFYASLSPQARQLHAIDYAAALETLAAIETRLPDEAAPTGAAGTALVPRRDGGALVPARPVAFQSDSAVAEDLLRQAVKLRTGLAGRHPTPGHRDSAACAHQLLSRQLAVNGRLDQAIGQARRAQQVWEDLAPKDFPGATVNLAATRFDIGRWLGTSGDHDGAATEFLAVLRMAVELDPADPDTGFLIADAHLELSNAESHGPPARPGVRDTALHHAGIAAKLMGELARRHRRHNPVRYGRAMHGHARALFRIALRLRALGRGGPATAALLRAHQILRRNSGGHPETAAVGIAIAGDNLARGRLDEAESRLAGAQNLLRSLPPQHATKPLWAESFDAAAALLTAREQYTEAVTASADAVAAARELGDPLSLARYLGKHSARLFTALRYDEADTADAEAVGLLSEAEDPNALRLSAWILSEASRRRAIRRQSAIAVEQLNRSAELRERLAAASDGDRLHCAKTWLELARLLDDAARPEAAIEAARKAIVHFDQSAEYVPTHARLESAACHNLIGYEQLRLADYPAAAEATRQAIDLIGEVIGTETAIAFERAGFAHSGMRDYRAAVEHGARAVTCWRQQCGDTDDHRPDLARALWNLSLWQGAAGDHEESAANAARARRAQSGDDLRLAVD